MLSLAACQPWPWITSDGANAPVHLVIDAGSSGTRYCAFPVARASDRGCAVTTLARAAPCVEVEARGGLADLSPAEVERVLDDGMKRLPPAVRANVQSAALLGTGGFRRHTANEQQATMDVIERWFTRERMPVTASVIDGVEEGRLAWLAVRESTGSRHHTIIETGGATVQLASGADGAVASVSATVGMNDSRRRLRNDARFRSCESPDRSATGLDADRCIALVADEVYRGSSIARPGFPVDATAYGMGAAWGAIFERYLKTDAIELDALRGFTRRVCRMSADEVAAAGYADGAFAALACYLLSYHVAQVESAGAGVIRTVRNGGESWPRGAAVDPKYFTSCLR